MKRQEGEEERVWIIMEDDFCVRYMLRAIFQLWGRRTLEFEDGHQGMQWVNDVREGRYDGPIPELIISNIRQPGPQGPEVCGEMRQIPELDEMAIVIASAWRCTPEEFQWVMQTSQADHFMRKPLPMPDELRAILEDVIDKRRRRVSSQIGEGGAV